MPICEKCGMIYTSPSGCPYCSDDGEQNTYIPNFSSSQSMVSRKAVDVEIPQNDPNSLLSQYVDDEYSYEPRNYILCPNCSEKNKRTSSHCVRCGHPLPIYDQRTEIKTQDQIITQLLDPNMRKQYFSIGLHLFISKLIGKEKKMRCNNVIHDPNDPSNFMVCDQILTPLDKECPKCGKKHAYYSCVNCQNLIPITSMSCPSCGSPSYLSDVITVIEGGGTGEGADQIIDDLQNVFGIPLRKQAISSFANQRDIINSKFRLESIARQLSEILDLLSAYLMDFMKPVTESKIKLAFRDQNASSLGVTEISKVGPPLPSQRLQNLIKDREKELQNNDPNNQTQTVPPPTNEVQRMDREDPWEDIQI